MEFISFKSLWWLLSIVLLFVGWRFSLVDRPMKKRIASFAFRILSVVFLILALCRPFAGQQSEKIHVVFLVDVSQSVDLQSVEKSAQEIQRNIQTLESADSWSLFAMGSDLIEFESTQKLLETVQAWRTEGADDAFRSETQIADGLLESRLSIPAGKAKRIVIYSDGRETGQRLEQTLNQLSEEEIDVRFNQIPSLQVPEAAVVSIRPSTTQAFVGEVVRFSVTLNANQNVTGDLRILHRGVAVQSQPVEVIANQESQFFFDVDMVTPGASRWTAELIPSDDHFPINNQRTCTVNARGKPRVLVLHEKPKDMRPFERAIAQQDIVLEVRGKFGLPETIQDLLAFDAVVLANFPATLMSPRQMDLLNRYVKDFGGGLTMIGSENSFGLGGYHKTPVEEVLPLVSRFEKEKEKPSLAMVLVIDKSGSMQGLPMALARQAAKSTVELLSARDQIGVIAFDGQPFIVSEIQSASLKDGIFANIDSIQAGGGTNMYPGMVVGKEMLEEATAKIKHMICLSDGHTQQADHESLVQAMTDSGITVSTVALGQADRHLMAAIAEIGRGRYYETQDPANVPQIFTKETMQASKSAIKEDLFGSVQSGDHPALAGFVDAELPFTLGYVMTQQKPTTQLLLVTETGDPLLAVSRFGLGVGLAFTGDLTERWGGEWLAWEDCGKFWGQIFRSIVRKNNSQGIEITEKKLDDYWQVDIRAVDPDGTLQSQVDWDMTLIDEQGKSNEIAVNETGLGRYVAAVPIADQKTCTIRLRDPASDKMRFLHYNRPYPHEYSLSTEVPESLARCSSVDASSMRADLVAPQVKESVAHWFYLLALVCLLLGNLFRRV